jgi:hypothetical protein
MGAIALRATKSFAPIRNNVQPVGFALPMTDKIESHYQFQSSRSRLRLTDPLPNSLENLEHRIQFVLGLPK